MCTVCMYILFLYLQTWYNVTKKIAYAVPSKSTFIIGPFLKFMFLSGKDSHCFKQPLECLKILKEVVQKINLKNFSLEVIDTFSVCLEVVKTEEEERVFLEIWQNVIGKELFLFH